MSDEKKGPSARNSFRVDGRCVTNGFRCEAAIDCRTCTVPISFGLIKVANAIKPVSKKDMELSKKLEEIDGLTEEIRGKEDDNYKEE